MTWPSVELQDFCRTGSGTTPSRAKPELYEGSIPWVKSGELREGVITSTEECVSREALNSTALKLVPKGALLVAMYGATVGRVGLLGVEATTNQAVCHVVPDPRKADTRYMFHILQAKAGELISRGVGGAQPNISQGIIKSTKIPLPPLEEQRRIAGILDQADALRRLRARALDKLSTLGQAIFHEMFGDPLKDHIDDRDWICEALDENIDYIDYRGKTPPKAETGIRLVTAKNVKMGYINPDPMEFIDADAFDTWMSRGFPKKGDVLFTTEAPLGNVAILDSAEKLVVGQRLITMQPDHRKILSEYLAYYLRSPEFCKRMMENSSGSTVRGIKSRLLKKIKICFPPIQCQHEFSKALGETSRLKDRGAASLLLAETLFASLQNRAFRGEL